MSDSELSTLLSDLRSSASQLNQETQTINLVIEQVERELESMNLGLEVWVQIGPDERIGYAKIAGAWCLGMEVDDGSGSPDGVVAKLSDSSRNIRLQAMRTLPSLLSALKEKANEYTNAIREGKKIVGLVGL